MSRKKCAQLHKHKTKAPLAGGALAASTSLGGGKGVGRGRQIASSSRRLISSVTKIRRQLTPPALRRQ
jgi:hypothetical protein